MDFGEKNKALISEIDKQIHSNTSCDAIKIDDESQASHEPSNIVNDKAREIASDTLERNVHDSNAKYDVISNTLPSKFTQEKIDLKGKKHNLLSNFRVAPPKVEDFSVAKTMESENSSIKEKKISLNKGASTDNELFVVDRRGSTVDCLESTPLPSPNLSEKSKLNSSIDIFCKSQAKSEQLSSQPSTFARLSIKRYVNLL